MILRTSSPSFFPLSSFAGLEAFSRALERSAFPFAEAPELPVEVVETEAGLSVVFEVPGVQAKDVKVDLEGNTLSVSVQRSQPARGETDSLLRGERAYGVATRALELPFAVNRDAVKATLRDGLLSIDLERAAEARPRTIQITAS